MGRETIFELVLFPGASASQATEEPAARRLDARTDEFQWAGVEEEAALAAFDPAGTREQDAVAGLQGAIELGDKVAPFTALQQQRYGAQRIGRISRVDEQLAQQQGGVAWRLQHLA